MGGGRKSKSKKSKTKTKAQKMAVANKAKYGGTAKAAAANKAANKAKAKSYTKTSGAATAAAKNKAAMKAKTKAKFTASQAAKKAAPSKGASISKGTSGIGPVKSGKTYSKAVSNATNAPTKKTSGVGPVASGKQYASMLKASPPKVTDGTKIAKNQGPSTPVKMYDGKMMIDTGAGRPGDVRLKPQYQLPVKTAMLPGDNMGSVLGTGAVLGFGLSLPGMIKNAIDAGGKLKENIEKRVNPDADKISAVGPTSLTGLGVGTEAPSYFSVKSPESFGYPSQAETDAAAGITAGGLNIGGSGFTPDKPSGSTTSRAVRDMTSEQLADRYDASLNPNSFKGLSDGETFGVGPVASGDAYARGLNTDNKNVENRLRQIRNLGSTLTGGLIPSVRKLTDKEIADRRIKNAAFREANLVGRKKGSGGGARLPVAPLTPEEIIEEAAVAQTVPDYQQALPEQTGVDPNRLMQIQQQAYARAFNPYNPLTVGGFNPMFRFFDRRRGNRRASFRKAFRRD